jgi:hypothetical protein
MRRMEGDFAMGKCKRKEETSFPGLKNKKEKVYTRQVSICNDNQTLQGVETRPSAASDILPLARIYESQAKNNWEGDRCAQIETKNDNCPILLVLR